MDCSEIQKDIALKICSIGNRMFQNDLPVIQSTINKEDMKELCRLLEKYNKLYPVDISKAESVILRELRSVTEKKDLNYMYKDNKNLFSLYFGLAILGRLEICIFQ